MRKPWKAQEKNPEALKEGLALLQNAQNLIGQCSKHFETHSISWLRKYEKIIVPHRTWPF
jgi:hypothetical protein